MIRAASGDNGPHMDRKGVSFTFAFGSAHPGSFNAVMTDGSVRHVNYNIEKTTFRRVGNRLDGNTLADF